MRISELWSLNKDTIDFDNKQMRIVGKGNKERTCFMNTETKEMLLKYLDSRTDNNTALFVNRNGERLGRREIQKFFKKAGLDAGIKKPVTPHKMRHSFGSRMVQNGAPIQVVQQCLGHQDIATTQIYSFLDNKTITDGYRAVFDKENK
jgi:integrase/recombinase XerD